MADEERYPRSQGADDVGRHVITRLHLRAITALRSRRLP